MLKTRNLLVVLTCLLLQSAQTSAPVLGADDGATQQRTPKSMTKSKDSSGTPPAKKHVARGIIEMEIDAPQEFVWNALTNFNSYPEVFKRIQSCKVTKREGDLVFTESYLKPHMFLNTPCQHAVNNLSGAPHVLTWNTIDGNFKSLEGRWELIPSQANASESKCRARYTLEVDAGCVPAPLVGMALRTMQKEIVASLKKSVETSYREQRVSTSKIPQVSPLPHSG